MLEYWNTVNFVQIMCDLKMVGARQAAESGREISDDDAPATCVRTGMEKIRTAFDRAVASVRKASAKAALREHYIAASSALRGVMPGIDERVITYRARTDSERRRADEAWERVKLEF